MSHEQWENDYFKSLNFFDSMFRLLDPINTRFPGDFCKDFCKMSSKGQNKKSDIASSNLKYNTESKSLRKAKREMKLAFSDKTKDENAIRTHFKYCKIVLPFPEPRF